jgi:hypothetical protein
MDEIWDWRQTRNKFRDEFQDLHSKRRSAWNISPNLLTQDVLGTFSFERGLDVEVSTGTFPDLGVRPRTEHRIYGISLRLRPTDKRSDAVLEEQIKDLRKLIRDDELTDEMSLRDHFDQIVLEAQRILHAHT